MCNLRVCTCLVYKHQPVGSEVELAVERRRRSKRNGALLEVVPNRQGRDAIAMLDCQQLGDLVKVRCPCSPRPLAVARPDRPRSWSEPDDPVYRASPNRSRATADACSRPLIPQRRPRSQPADATGHPQLPQLRSRNVLVDRSRFPLPSLPPQETTRFQDWPQKSIPSRFSLHEIGSSAASMTTFPALFLYIHKYAGANRLHQPSPPTAPRRVNSARSAE